MKPPRHDKNSPVYDYLNVPGSDDKNTKKFPAASYLPAVGQALTPDVALTAPVQEFITYIERGDVHQLAEALVANRLETLAGRREMLNTIRRYIGLDPRTVPIEAQINHVTRQLTDLYDRARKMIESKNQFADSLITYRTKAKELELTEESLNADIEEAKLRAAKARAERDTHEGNSRSRRESVEEAEAKQRIATAELQRQRAEAEAQNIRGPKTRADEGEERIRNVAEDLDHIEATGSKLEPKLAALRETYGEDSEVYKKAKRRVEAEILNTMTRKH